MRLELVICRLSVYHPLCCPIILLCSTNALNNCFPRALPVLHPSSLPHCTSFPQHTLFIFLFMPLSVSSPCLYFGFQRARGFIPFSFPSLLLFSSVCLFGRLPCNQREPASCVLYCPKRPVINRANRISRSDMLYSHF